MELSCPSRSLPALVLPHRKPFTLTPSLLPLSSPKPLSSLSKPGLRRRDVRVLASEEASTFVSEKFERSTNEIEVDKIEEPPSSETVSAEEEGVSVSEATEVDKIEEPPSSETVSAEEEGVSVSEATDFLSNLNLKWDTDNAYSILVYGTGALVALWLSSAVVGAIDSIPVFPKVMEVVGLAYTIWFSYRYLIFKENREELVAKIEDLKQEIIGTTDE